MSHLAYSGKSLLLLEEQYRPSQGEWYRPSQEEAQANHLGGVSNHPQEEQFKLLAGGRCKHRQDVMFRHRQGEVNKTPRDGLSKIPLGGLYKTIMTLPEIRRDNGIIF